MRFGQSQRDQLAQTWNESSWFYQVLGEPVRQIISKAYGLTLCTPTERSKCQEDVTLATSIFAANIGADKSHVVHALLSGSVTHLLKALERVHGNTSNYTDENWGNLQDYWTAAFRQINLGRP